MLKRPDGTVLEVVRENGQGYVMMFQHQTEEIMMAELQTRLYYREANKELDPMEAHRLQEEQSLVLKSDSFQCDINVGDAYSIALGAIKDTSGLSLKEMNQKVLEEVVEEWLLDPKNFKQFHKAPWEKSDFEVVTPIV